MRCYPCSHILWSQEFAIGISEIDEQHRHLVELINSLTNNPAREDPATTESVLTELNDYVRDHFTLEERLMDGAGFDAEFVARHCAEHAYFVGALRDFTADFRSGRSGVTVSLIEYLVHWLLHHIVVVDREMSDQYRAGGTETAARFQSLAQGFSDDLEESERHLIADLQHENNELAKQVALLQRQLAELKKSRG